MAMRQDQATFVVGSQLATDQRGCLRQGNRDQPARGQDTGISEREELASARSGNGIGQLALGEWELASS